MNKKISTLLIAYILLVIPLASICMAGFLVVLTGEQMSLQARQEPLKEIVRGLQEQGVSVSIDPRINPQVTASFTEESVERVLSSILKSYNYSLIWQKSGKNEAAELNLIGLKIFLDGYESRAMPLVKDSNLKIAQTDTGIYYVKNRLLIKLEKHVDEQQIKNVLGRIGATIVGSFNPLGIIRVELPDSLHPVEAAKILSSLNEIAAAEPDYAYPLDHNYQALIPAGISDSEPDVSLSDYGLVAVLDSGLSERYAASPFVSSVYDAFEQRSFSSDNVGHGTQMSLIASGVVHPLGTAGDQEHAQPIVVVRAFDDNGFTSNYTLMRSIDYALASDVQVVSMSWGSEQSNSMLQNIVDYAVGEGLILIAAAGNSPTGLPVYPAAYDQVIGVGALNPDGSTWEQSNFGDFVSLYAPGFAEIESGNNDQVGLYGGTSISTAYVASQMARMVHENPELTSQNLVELFKAMQK